MKISSRLIIILSVCVALSVLAVWYRQSRDTIVTSPPIQSSSSMSRVNADAPDSELDFVDSETQSSPPIDEALIEADEKTEARDVAGVTLPELFANADQTIRNARLTLGDEQCLTKSLSSEPPEGCFARSLYDAALLLEYCGQKRGPIGPFDPERLDLLGVTDLAERRKAEAERVLQAEDNRYIREQCEGLSQSLLSLPTLTGKTDGDGDKLSKLWPNVPYMRLHAALLGDERAMRWAVQDWRYVDEDYLGQQTIDSIVTFVESRDPAEGHRLRYQFERYREPDTYLWVERPDAPRDEERLVEAAAHLIAWQRLSGSMYERPADLRWQDMKERHFLKRLDENTRSLAQHRANQLLNDLQIPLQREPDVGRLVAQLQLDIAELLANVVQVSDQSFQRRTTLKAQYLSRLSIQCRTMVLDVVAIDPDINNIRLIDAS